MGGKQSSQRHGGHRQQNEQAELVPKPEATVETGKFSLIHNKMLDFYSICAEAAATAAAPVNIPDKVDVIVFSTTTERDITLAKLIKGILTAAV